VSSTRREEFPKPGKPVYHPGSILEDLRRRDFTANAMALSLNEGSYGLLMDPLNGVADLEARVLRLVSNYGFLEDPIRLIRAARFQARLGWELDEKTKTRFENAREEGVIAQISPYQQGYEVEEIVHEEDGLKILKALEEGGWMKFLCPAWSSAKVDVDALEASREVLVQLQMQGVNPDPSAAQAQLLTGKLSPKDLASLKKMFVRQGFVWEWESQDERAKEFAKRLTGKEAATPSAAWKLLTTADPEAVLWLGLTSKSAPVQAKFKDFFTVWPEARQRIPYAIMQEMRITPEIEGYQDLLRSIFFELIDGRLTTEEEIRQLLEPHSPPAPPPPVTIRRPRAKKSAERNREAKEIDDEELADGRSGRDDEDAEDEEHGDDENEHEELVVRPVLPILPLPETRLKPPSAPSEPETALAKESKLPAKESADTKAASHAAPPAAVKKAPPAQPSGKSSPKPVVKVEPKVPAKAAPVAKHASKHVAAPPTKAAVKGKASAEVSPSKSSAKKVAAKAAPKSKLLKSPVKARSAKSIVKAKPAPSRLKPAIKSKPVAMKAVKSSKTASAKKKR
jgi:tRNA nucleotidyltransferase/poly(A) polymerase